ncbi:MAG: PH domain-containing protein [Patescibacteria group bacterium]|nr:PH domain-containing protein [Patescibacteria group bacterium]
MNKKEKTNENYKVWRKVLHHEEKIIYQFSIGEGFRKFGLIAGVIVGIITSWLYFGVLIIIASIVYFNWYLKVANVYAFTDQRVLIHQGWLSTQLKSVDYNKITDIQVKEPIFDKLVSGTGHLIINTAGGDEKEIVLLHISQPYEKKKKLDEIRQK